MAHARRRGMWGDGEGPTIWVMGRSHYRLGRPDAIPGLISREYEESLLLLLLTSPEFRGRSGLLDMCKVDGGMNSTSVDMTRRAQEFRFGLMDTLGNRPGNPPKAKLSVSIVPLEQWVVWAF